MYKYYIILAPTLRTIIVLFSVELGIINDVALELWILSVVATGTIYNFVANSSLGSNQISLENIVLAVSLAAIFAISTFGLLAGFLFISLSLLLSFEARDRVSLAKQDSLLKLKRSAGCNILILLAVLFFGNPAISYTLVLILFVVSLKLMLPLERVGFAKSISKSWGSIALGATGQASIYLIAYLVTELGQNKDGVTAYYLAILSIGMATIIQRQALTRFGGQVRITRPTWTNEAFLVSILSISLFFMVTMDEKWSLVSIIPAYTLVSVSGYLWFLHGSSQNSVGTLARISLSSVLPTVLLTGIAIVLVGLNGLWLCLWSPAIRNYFWKRSLSEKAT